MEQEHLDTWRRELERASVLFQDVPGGYLATYECREQGERLRAVSYAVTGVACEKCGGFGTRAYSSTSTWRRGIGGQAITQGVCDVCWGTGRNDSQGVDLRGLSRAHQAIEHVVGQALAWAREHHGEGLDGCDPRVAELTRVAELLRPPPRRG